MLIRIFFVEGERDSSRFHWKEPNCTSKVYRFTCALFGLTSLLSFWLMTVNNILIAGKGKYPELEAVADLYIDDLMISGVTVGETREKKHKAIEVFQDATLSFANGTPMQKSLKRILCT